MGTEANLLVNRGTLYVAPTGESLPEIDDIEPPGITVTPAGNWTAVGFTDDENHIFNLEVEYQVLYVSENLPPVKIVCIREGGTLSIKFIESDLTALNTALSSRTTLSTVSAGADQTAQDILKFGDKSSTTEKALLYVASNPEGGSRLIHMPYAVATGGLSIPMGKQVEGYDVEFTLRADTSASAGETLLVIYDITAQASS